ncbi:non-ribosomal peptide synthetase [Microcoleus sp. FACHB-672]|uniref:non-ribosomal peptide synthetase n=1 Tax=Microcoleus sp. FACHB-672 TaxID=2692825 RepID=UPI0016823705|nr:non-ribosomal peptide synthetase [Microcoleus sp. FACHB-672]MBD2043500.1 amino acid adenylation domain-containing protein [Microcoleus sp. FACHB-672]
MPDISKNFIADAKTKVNLPEEEVFIFPASFSQQRLWFFDQLIPGTAAYNVPTVIRLTGTLNLTALERTLNEIVRRHEVLRTAFVIVEGQPFQAIAPSLNVAVPVLDLQQLPTTEREAEAKRLITAECERPFNLSQGPLLRVTLLRLDEREHILLLNMHHIVADDWSIGVLIRELGIFYTAFAENRPALMPALPLQYADFAEWQREWLQGDVLETQLAYWRQQLAGIEVLNLPVDRPRPATQTYRGATQYLEISKELSESLEKLSQHEEVTLFMTLLAAFQTLIYRHTYQEDIAIGSPIANRNRSEIEKLIGFFINTLVLRTDLSGNPTFRELLARVREVTLGAYAHQDLPFEKLVEELHPERNLSRHPLFQVVFALQNAPMEGLQLPGLAVSSVNIETQTTRFDLELHLWKSSSDFRSIYGEQWQNSEGFRGIVVYNTDLFDQATISRMIEHFSILLKNIVANPDQRIGDLSILSDLEQHQILVEFNNNLINNQNYISKQKGSIPQLFEAQVEQNPDKLAVIFEDEKLTYGELNIRSNKLAHYLQKLGVGSEVVTGICLEPSAGLIVAMLAILKAGGAYLSLDPSYPRERLSFMLEDAQVSLVITHSLLEIDYGNTKFVCLDKDEEVINRESGENLKNSINEENLAYVIYTSGSTGKPKGVAISHKAAVRTFLNPNYIKIEPTDKIAQVSNTSFDAAAFEIWGALLHGAQLVLINRNVILSPQNFARQLRNNDISILFLTTALFNQMASVVPQAFNKLIYLLFGGEMADLQWVREVLKKGAPQQLIHLYGPTENTTFSSFYCIGDIPESATSIPIGRPVTDTQIYLLDQQLQPAPIGVAGELYISGERLARGYLNRPDLTAERFIPNPFGDEKERGIISSLNSSSRVYKTGDLARYLPDGNIEFLGRIDEQVKIRGFRIELGEIEATLSQHPAIKQIVAIAKEDISANKRIVAYIVPSNSSLISHPSSLISTLRQFLAENLPEYMVPSAFVVLESLPLTFNGKIDRRRLSVIDILENINENYVAPSTAAEEVLAGIWAEILGLKQVSIHDNFFELGGHSLLATQLVSRVRDAFEVELPLRNLFEAPTVAHLAKYIETVCWAAKGLNLTQSGINEREEIEF